MTASGPATPFDAALFESTPSEAAPFEPAPSGAPLFQTAPFEAEPFEAEPPEAEPYGAPHSGPAAASPSARRPGGMARDWTVRRHRGRTRALAATRSLAVILGLLGLVSLGTAAAGMLGIRPVSASAAPHPAWQQPAQVSTPPPAAPAVHVPKGAPTSLRIPSISVNTKLEAIGLDAAGHLNPPGYDDAGWYAEGTLPGDEGPAVIAGHYDGTEPGARSVFYRLGQLKPGDTVQVRRSGKWLTFVVTEVSSYPRADFPTSRVYGPVPAADLRLITCGGTFDAASGTYDDNVVVFATEQPA